MRILDFRVNTYRHFAATTTLIRSRAAETARTIKCFPSISSLWKIITNDKEFVFCLVE
jgi:hypothetical protein